MGGFVDQAQRGLAGIEHDHVVGVGGGCEEGGGEGRAGEGRANETG